MTAPNGAAGLAPAAKFGVLQTGVENLPHMTQDNVTALLKTTFGAGGGSMPDWGATLESIGSDIWNAFHGLEQVIAGIGGTIATDISDTILTLKGGITQLVTWFNQMITAVGGTVATDITNTILTVRGALTTLSNALQHAAGTVIGDISSVLADGQHALQDIWNAIGSGLGGALSGHTATTLNAAAVQQAIDVQDALAASYAAQWTLQQQSGSGAGSAGGSVFEMDITGADGDALPATDWSTTSNMNVRVVGSVAAMGMSATAPVGTLAYADCAHLYTTDGQSIAVVLGPKGDSTAQTILHFHCNSAKTAGLYLAITTTGAVMGYFTGAVGARTYTPLSGGTVTKSLSSGGRVEVRNGAAANTYDILVNGVAQLTVSDPGAHAVAGSFNAQVTMTSRTVTYNAGLPWQTTSTAYSFWLSAILVADYSLPTYVGSGAKIYRTSTVNVGVSSGANPLPANTFGVNGGNTGDIAVDLPNGKFTVSRTDWYYVTFRLALTVSSDSGSGTTGVGYNVTPFPMQMAIYRNGSFEKYAGEGLRPYVTSVGITGGGNTISISAVGPDAAYGSASIYLNAGDYVQIGYNATSADSSTFTGEATGTKTYFEIQGQGQVAA